MLNLFLIQGYKGKEDPILLGKNVTMAAETAKKEAEISVLFLR